MANLTIRRLDDAVMAQLKQRARLNHRSLEGEVREILTRAVQVVSRDDLRAVADRIAAMAPPVPQADSTRLIRDDRDHP